MTAISDNPGVAAAITGFAVALLALLVAFGVHLTDAQIQAILAVIAALWILIGIVSRYATVAKTPSNASPALLQVPPPGTVLVTTQAAAAAAPVPAGSVIASSPVPLR